MLGQWQVAVYKFYNPAIFNLCFLFHSHDKTKGFDMRASQLIFILVFSLTGGLSAQPFTQGVHVINAGIGLGSSLGGFGYTSQTPGLCLSYEYGMWPVAGPGLISLGGYLGYKSFAYRSTYLYQLNHFSYEQKWQYLILGARSAYHYNGLEHDKIDLYGGLMLSFNNLSYRYSDNNPVYDYPAETYNSGLSLSLFAGGRYFFTDQIGAYAEAGYGIAYLSIGVAVKF